MTRRSTRPSNPQDPPAPNDAAAWYDEKAPSFRRLGLKVEGVLAEVLSEEGLDGARVSHRTKERRSLIEKALRYSTPRKEIHDFCGLRIVTSFPSEARKAADMVRGLFAIDEALSVDKAADLGVDRVGYLAVHLVAEITADRAVIREWAPFAGVKFEIQIRTILQDAWAQFEHDRNYKFAGELPPELQRRLKLAAGLLEVADREFDRIAADVDSYSHSISVQTARTGPNRRRGLRVPLNNVALRTYLRTRFQRLVEIGALELTYPNTIRASEILDELRSFGIGTLADLDAIVPEDFEGVVIESRERTNVLGLCRSIMIIADAQKYFNKAWAEHWQSFDPLGLGVLVHYGTDLKIVQEHVTIEPRD